jgi:quercetin dioxygenase-like cupin family protein
MNMINPPEAISRDLFPGVHAKLIHTPSVTIAHVNLDAGAVVPLHSHVHEQTINGVEGTFELTMENKTQTITAPFICVVPSNVTHAVTAISAGKIIDVFHPVREDLK